MTPRAGASSTTTSRCWPRTRSGYRNLIQLSSLAFLEGYYYKPRIDWELLERYHDGIIATTGCLGGHVLQAMMQGDEKGAFDKAGRLQEIFGKDNLFVELQDHGLQAQRDTNPKLVEIAPGSAPRCSPPTTRTTRIARITSRTTRCCACRRAR